MKVVSKKESKGMTGRTPAAGPEVRETADKGGQISAVKFGIRLKFSLAIISLVVLIIVSITLFFIWRESNILTEQIKRMWERETEHLANTAQVIDVENIPLSDAINDLKKFKYLTYAFILDKKDTVRENFDRREKTESRTLGQPLDDKVERNLSDRTEEEHVRFQVVPDLIDPAGNIWDFSLTVLGKINGKKIGTVIIGMSDVIIRDAIRELVVIIVPIALGFLLIAIVAAIVLATFTIRPVKALSKGAEIIGKGNLDYRIEIKSRDELGKLADEFNLMTAKIKEAKDKEIKSRILQDQLEMAREIQEGLNPMAFYEKRGVQIKGYTKALEGVGGDYFDYIDINDDKVGALISDVSGKGVPASLVMVMIRTVFTSYISRKDVNCASVVRAINESMSMDLAIDKFATLFFMIYDRKSEELAFSNAGQGPLFCYRSSMKACTITKLDGVPIGIVDDFEYKQARVKLNPGDMIVLSTDGVTEMRNADQEEYGLKRLQKLLVENNHLNASQFVDLLVNDLEKFRGDVPAHDDTTVLVLKRIA
jgi:serine phosphatase RsbU (regulator of sigma subunit)